MLTFFRKLRKTLLGAGQVRKYLVYAFGEIALVVIGILIALQINNWNEWRKDRVIERELLFELKSNIEANIQFIRDSREIHQRAIAGCEIILNVIDRQYPWNDSLSYYFARSLVTTVPTLSFSAYESLRDYGVGIISSKPLQQNIMDLYENFQNLESKMTRVVHTELKPHTSKFWTENFRSSKDDQRRIIAIPNNYQELLKDPEYLNIITFVQNYRSGLFKNLETESLDKSEKVLKMIVEELHK